MEIVTFGDNWSQKFMVNSKNLVIGITADPKVKKAWYHNW
jgi:hypothetical protein